MSIDEKALRAAIEAYNKRCTFGFDHAPRVCMRDALEAYEAAKTEQPVELSVEDCAVCKGQGWYAGYADDKNGNRTDDPIQIQCGYCYATGKQEVKQPDDCRSAYDTWWMQQATTQKEPPSRLESFTAGWNARPTKRESIDQEAHKTGICVSCNAVTMWACADCKIDTGKSVYVCGTARCRNKHEATGECTRKINGIEGQS